VLKRIFSDPAFLFLIAINGYCIWYYQQNPGEFNTIGFLYWGQSVLIGLFNFADILTIKNIVPGSMEWNDRPLQNNRKAKGCAAAFFAVHYGFFHLAYGMYLLFYTKLRIDFNFVLLGLAAFSFSLIIDFIRHKQWQADHPVNLGKMFFLPYLRIIPMHLMILGPAFLHWKASTIFLVLKTLADLIMYFITSPLHREESAARNNV
jgi:hypothetical protein